MTSILSLEDISCLDRQIDLLMDYKPIPEHEVKQLCDKVLIIQYKTFSISNFSIKLLIINFSIL
jgi:hypothetical protein